MALIDKLNDLGDAVRERSGVTEKMTLEQMAQQVKDIPYPVVDEITITENGTYTPNEGVDGFNEVIVDIPEVVCPECPEVEPPVIEALSITENGVYTAPAGIDGYSPITVDVPSGGGALPEEAFNFTGICTNRFAYNGWNWFIEEYGNRINTSNIYSLSGTFDSSDKLEQVQFDLNISSSISELRNCFKACNNLKAVPLIKGPERNAPTSDYSGVIYLNYIFQGCYNLREIPYDYFWQMIPNSNYWDGARNYAGGRDSMFWSCYSLRELPDISMLAIKGTNFTVPYYNLIQQCYTLNKATNIPVCDTSTLTSNGFSKSFNNCSRLNDVLFEVNEDGTNIVVNWKSQVIDLSVYLGYAQKASFITTYNSGITADKEVKDDATYQALKDDPDWFTINNEYSRYNHDSAVRTIQSLPDSSAYGTNTIKFRGVAGRLTDGGAINTLTEEEIAVAASKGWTVTFV